MFFQKKTRIKKTCFDILFNVPLIEKYINLKNVVLFLLIFGGAGKWGQYATG